MEALNQNRVSRKKSAPMDFVTAKLTESNGEASEEIAVTAHEQTQPSLSIKDHFALNLYASIYCLCYYIHRLNGLGGNSVEQHFKRFPFIQEYFAQASSVMPKDLDWPTGMTWWCDNLVDLEEKSDGHLPLKALRENLPLSFSSKMALMLAGLVEEDSRFGTLLAELQQPLSYRRPMLETLGHIVAGENIDRQQNPWDIVQPLIQNGLVQVENTQAPRSEWLLKVNPQVWDIVRGNFHNKTDVSWTLKEHSHLLPIGKLIIDSELRIKLQSIPELMRADRIGTLVIRAQEGSHSVDIIGAVARELGRSIIVVEPARKGEQSSNNQNNDDGFGILCTLLNALPVFIFDLTPGETTHIPKLKGYNGPVGIIMGEEGGLDSQNSERVVTLSLSGLNPQQRKSLWQEHLQNRDIHDLDRIAAQFRLPGDFIQQVCKTAINNASLEQRNTITIDDVRVASRNLNRQKLDSLADPLEAKGSWAHLISVETTAEKLNELQQRCSYREQLLNHLGPAFKNSSNCGVRALFTGRSGTGKTLAAKILAAELGMDIYRVDLASIVNKYIGETEKNLHKVLTRAEALDVILLLDEGDSLLGARTDVKTANDRYANLETNYLLQRLEHYKGVVLVTTNLSDNIDKAFQRRMDIVVPFFQPQMEQRLAIFNLHLPDSHQIDQSYLDKAANFCILMGGQIRNVCLHAALLALDEGEPVGNRHLANALRSEYRKNGGTFPLDNHSRRSEPDGGMGCFMNALAQNR
jgi:ATPase family associated with various cellular activities (AAA)